jgi:cellulose synthase/poly-beta-1,6-N-acetylglucosamine synthase-like glycosyltransferase
LIIDISLFTGLFVSLSVLYFVLLIFIFIALRNLNGSEEVKSSYRISIIIAARNEALHIQNCLESLTKLDYPKDLHEIIIVDDCSIDETATIINQYCEVHPNWHLVRIKSKSTELRGKKNALQEGIKRASGELIFTTDADCVVNPAWIKSMSHYFMADVVMVIGFSPLIQRKGFGYRLLEFDTLFSTLVAAASVKLGYPFTSTGRNLAYRKSAYKDSGGFLSLKKYRSGDDMHLTRKFREKKIGKIQYCAQPDTFVKTWPPTTFSHFFQQQLRKNSKILQSGLSTGFFALLIFIYHILFYTIPFISTGDITIWSIFVCMKFLIELIVLFYAIQIFNQKQLISFLPISLLIYPLFIIFFSILGAFQKYKWKN